MNKTNIVVCASVGICLYITAYCIRKLSKIEKETDYITKKSELQLSCDDAKVQIRHFEVPYCEKKLKNGMLDVSKSDFIDWFDVVHNNLIFNIDEFLYRVETQWRIDIQRLIRHLECNVALYKNARTIFDRYMQYEKSKVSTLLLYMPLSLAKLVSSYMVHSYNFDINDFIFVYFCKDNKK